MNRIYVVSLCALMTGCVNPLNLHTAREYFNGGKQLEEEGDWFKARMAFGRAWTNAVVGKADDPVTAVYAYEYGRASGVICDWKEAEHGLTEAHRLDVATHGPVHMSLVEMARMHHAHGELEESARGFSEAKAVLDELQADTRDSIGYANILHEYADVLAALGKAGQAAPLLKREAEIRSVFPDRKSQHELTPYGAHCEQNPSLQAPAKAS